MYSSNIEQFIKTFIIINRLYELKETSNDIINKHLEEQYKVKFLKYIGSLYQYNNQDIVIEIHYHKKPSFSYLLDNVKEYVQELCQTPEFEWKNICLWALKIFKEIITTVEQYNLCSEEAQQVYSSLVANEEDPLWDSISQERKDQVLLGKEVYKKEQDIKELKAKIVTECIPLFFDKAKLFKDIDKIKDYFEKSEITYEDLSHYQFDMLRYKDPQGFLNQEIIILNPFLYDYLHNVYHLFHSETINIDNIFKNLTENWDKNWGLHLYNYLIHIKKNYFSFTEDQQEQIRSYFNALKTGIPKDIAYVYWHLETVFGFSIEKLNTDMIEAIMQTNYTYLRDSYPQPVSIYNNVIPSLQLGIIDDSLEFENKDFSKFISNNAINKDKLLNKLIKTIDIKNSWQYKYTNGVYFHLLSIINIYDLIEDKDKYTDEIKKLVLLYIDTTIQNSGSVLFLSKLVQNTTKQQNLVNDVLSRILGRDSIQACHLQYVDNIQNDIFHERDQEVINQVNVDLIYQIRQQVEQNQKTVKIYENTQNKDNIDLSAQREQFDELSDTIKNITLNNRSILTKNQTLELSTQLSKLQNDIEKQVEQQNTNYSKENNTLNLLCFLDKDISIWKNFVEKSVKKQDHHWQYIGIQILSYIIQNNKINMVTFTEVIQNRYPNLPPKEIYPVGVAYNPKFELIEIFNSCIENIITTDFSYEEYSYDNLLSIEKLNPNVKERIEYRKKKIPFTMIAKKDSLYCILNTDKSTKKSFENIEKIAEYILSRFDEDQNISQIKQFKHLIDNIKDKKFTMSHPYCFEDKIENQYDINEKLYISCWSFTAKRENAYAWWKLYGKHKNSFRSIITLRSLIISMISILDNYKHSTLYIGNIDYNKLGSIDDAYKHKSEIDFFNKREDFKFENELRIMMKIDKSGETDKENSVIYENHLPVRYSFPLTKIDMYRDIKLDEELLLFNPYDLTLLEKDKKAMIQILKKQNK